MVGDYMNRMNVDDEAMAGTLHLNANSTLVQQLAQAEVSKERDAALELIYQMARLFAGRMLDTTDVTHAFRMSAASIQNLLKGDD
jgi:HSP90 family molecular chaperone